MFFINMPAFSEPQLVVHPVHIYLANEVSETHSLGSTERDDKFYDVYFRLFNDIAVVLEGDSDITIRDTNSYNGKVVDHRYNAMSDVNCVAVCNGGYDYVDISLDNGKLFWLDKVWKVFGYRYHYCNIGLDVDAVVYYVEKDGNKLKLRVIESDGSKCTFTLSSGTKAGVLADNSKPPESYFYSALSDPDVQQKLITGQLEFVNGELRENGKNNYKLELESNSNLDDHLNQVYTKITGKKVNKR
ncbi:hypothetical protein FRA_41c10750 [Francisella sp. W12-1067]|nr:hypothetical protein FRA_41c10750 [Francisella sp. W12-1067]